LLQVYGEIVLKEWHLGRLISKQSAPFEVFRYDHGNAFPLARHPLSRILVVAREYLKIGNDVPPRCGRVTTACANRRARVATRSSVNPGPAAARLSHDGSFHSGLRVSIMWPWWHFLGWHLVEGDDVDWRFDSDLKDA